MCSLVSSSYIDGGLAPSSIVIGRIRFIVTFMKPWNDSFPVCRRIYKQKRPLIGVDVQKELGVYKFGKFVPEQSSRTKMVCNAYEEN